MEHVRYSIRELAERTAVPPSSIHHYRRLGLLPDPQQTAPNRFWYDDRHVSALRVIRSLRARDVPLEAIRGALTHVAGVRHEFREDAISDYLSGRAPEPSPRSRLIAIAGEAFAARGYGEVSISDLCDRADIGKGTFYRYFDGKEALFLAAARALSEQVVGGFAAELAVPGGGDHATLLATHLRRKLPVLLELATRALQDPDPLAGAPGAIFADLAEGLGRAIGRDDGAPESGGLLILLAVVRIFTELVPPQSPGRPR